MEIVRKRSSLDKKEELRQYFKKIKKDYGYEDDPAVLDFLAKVDRQQKNIIDCFDIEKIIVVEYNLAFPKRRFINTVSSLCYKGRPGRKMDLLVYHGDVLLGYIQYASPIVNSPINRYLKERYGRWDYKWLNQHAVELSVCVPLGILARYLTGKLLVLVSMSRECLDRYNHRYGTKVQELFTTGCYGRSSMYNRVRGLRYLGLTQGWHSLLTRQEAQRILDRYHHKYPWRQIKRTAQGVHLIRLLDHLGDDTVPRQQRGVYVATGEPFRPLQDNLLYWYKRWFVGRRTRLLTELNKNVIIKKRRYNCE